VITYINYKPKPKKKEKKNLHTWDMFQISNKYIPNGKPQPHPKINYYKNSIPELFSQTNMFNPSQNFFKWKMKNRNIYIKWVLGAGVNSGASFSWRPVPSSGSWANSNSSFGSSSLPLQNLELVVQVPSKGAENQNQNWPQK